MQKRKGWKITAGLLLCALLAPQGVHAEKEVIVPYTDIWTHWAKKSIFKGVEEGLFAESKDGCFYPDRLMTRAEFLVLLDRLFLRNQEQLQPLSLLSESFLLGREDDFSDPSLPYTDVNRLTWMYRPILRASLFLDNIFGPGALQQTFPGDELHPSRPITRKEAARLLHVFLGGKEDTDAWKEIVARSWLKGDEADPLSRAEAAVLADHVIQLVDADGLLPTLDTSGAKYPLVPDIAELFPAFATYTEWRTADDEAYLAAADAIRMRQDDENTYAELQRLAESDYHNKVGVYYYLSWSPDIPLQQNLDYAFAAIDAYFADRIVLPDTMRLLVANVYDIILQMEAEDEDIYAKTIERLQNYQSKMKKDTKEWKAYSIYLAAMEANRGDIRKALSTYEEIGDTSESLRNMVYYLIQLDRLEEAKAVAQSAAKEGSPEELLILQRGLLQDLEQLAEQKKIAGELTFVLSHFDQQQDYRIDGYATLGGYRFKYTQEIDQDRGTTHTTGYYQAPDKFVLQKMESYSDDSQKIEYIRDHDEENWTKSRLDSLDYMYEWIEKQPIRTRINELQARYELQSYGPYDIITEWIPGEAIVRKAKELHLENGRVRNVPFYTNKYYIERESDSLVAHQWRYEEMYDSKQYVFYTGKEAYELYQDFSIHIPAEIAKGVNSTR